MKACGSSKPLDHVSYEVRIRSLVMKMRTFQILLPFGRPSQNSFPRFLMKGASNRGAHSLDEMQPRRIGCWCLRNETKSKKFSGLFDGLWGAPKLVNISSKLTSERKVISKNVTAKYVETYGLECILSTVKATSYKLL